MSDFANTIRQAVQVVPDLLLVAIVALPALGALASGLLGRRLPRDAIHAISCGVVFISFGLSVLAFWQLWSMPAEGRTLQVDLYQWFTVAIPSVTDHLIPINVAFRLDPLSATMLLVVTGVGALIHMYSTGYMGHDESPARFFSYLNLFTFSMLLLILGESLPVMFVGWEGVGLCSYLLIGFWFDKEDNALAGRKAFIVNRIGDLGFLIGIFLLATYLGALSFPGMEDALVRSPGKLGYPAFELDLWGLHLAPSIATVAALCLFVGACGKSAQIPLYVWLPDAMAGPTPVSALIHAATMVTAGVYMVARMDFLFALSEPAMAVVALTGAATALFAATIALTQNDIKKVLAYSTVSQLGYMFVAVGVGAFAAGIFHVVTHAFFKACLFLGAGSVIHAMSGEQDIRRMGGLGDKLPRTRWTFLLSTFAISGLPLVTSGFYSKDAILWYALTRAGGRYEWLPYVLYGTLLLGAALTAFYMFRLYFLVFAGDCRADPHTRALLHESPASMTVPLIVLALLSVVGGGLNAEALEVLLPWLGVQIHVQLLHGWLEPVMTSVALAQGKEWLATPVVLASSVVALAGILLAKTLYGAGPSAQSARLAGALPRTYRLVLDKYRIDGLYELVIVRPLQWTAELGASIVDRLLIDKLLVHGATWVARAPAWIVQMMHTGRLSTYATVIAVGVFGILYTLSVPEAQVVQSQLDGRNLEVVALQGPGYRYRWDFDGDGRWDTQFATEPKAEHRYRRPGRYQLRFEVTNAFSSAVGSSELVVKAPPGRGGRVR